MELLRFSELACHYGAREIFGGLSGVVQTGERIALVGPNGAGKSSLLRLLADVDELHEGTVVRAKELHMGYLAQSVADETQLTLQELIDAALERAPDAQWGLRNKTLRTMLTAFGFDPADYSRPLREFSGGQRAKAALAHLLIDDPDYLVLDEPTNHLDIETVRWLEGFIASDKRAYVIVSHDRYFIDRVATAVWELEGGRLHAYPPAQPAYTAFMEARAARLEDERRVYGQYIAERDKRKATIAGLRSTLTSSNYSRVRSREKQLERVEATMQAPEHGAERARIKVRLRSARRAGNGFAFEIEGLKKAYDGILFAGLTVALQQGERLAIVGPNGAGKSTLLKILAGEVGADAGTVHFNPAARIAYFAQSAHDELDVESSAVDAVAAAAPVTAEEARALLGRMRISGEAADKPVRAFSGGERRRIMLARLMARKADVLLLDEPTNDLDIDSREALEDVLDEYEGAIVVVSHDRYLLARLSDRVVWIDDGKWGALEGGYDAYEALMRSRDDGARTAQREKADVRKAARQTPLKVRSQLEAQVARVEREIAQRDARKAEIELLFEDPALYADRARYHTLQEELAGIVPANEAAVKTWENLSARLEDLTRTG
ncbi:MAG: ABC-F family ATP-binding cassette domain-containing protein [Candidatus Eremiobacteraeota bacterium]|nr:ABC-F family ATP-binding cassette domain-containing protein [Candidatus Eremiobacteraeota bacterium]